MFRRRLVLAVMLGVPALVAAGALFNLVSVAVLRARHPVPGALYKVGGRLMHMYCTGEGSPTVVLESGGGNDWVYWQKVQPAVAETTRVCSYDRAGLGWSDSQPGPRDATTIAAQLQALLQEAGEAGPVVMVGASAGGFYVREFAATYPARVVGVVFVDASVPEQFAAIPGAGDSAGVLRQKHREARWQWLKEASGWARLTGRCAGDVPDGLEAYAGFTGAEACSPFAGSALGEWDEFWHSGDEAARARCCGALPVLIVSQDPDRPKPGWSAESIAVQPIWNSLQESLKRLSPHSRRIVARNSGHHVMVDRPDVVAGGIRQLVTAIRTGSLDGGQSTTVVQ